MTNLILSPRRETQSVRVGGVQVGGGVPVVVE